MKAFLALRSMRTITSSVCAAAFLASPGPSPVLAETSTWFGGAEDSYWMTSFNWDIPPSGTGEALVFSGFVGTVNTNNLGAGMVFGGITFESPAGAFVLRGDSVTLSGGITNNQDITPQTIHLPFVLNATAVVDVANAASLTVDGGIAGAGFGLTKVGGGTLTLGGSNSYTGNTIIGDGTVALVNSTVLTHSPVIELAASNTNPTLDVCGRADSRLTLAGNQTLTGNGTILGGLTVNAGAVVSPGQPLGTLTVTSDLNLNGSTLMNINSVAGTHDQIVAADITYGGTLTVNDLGSLPGWCGGTPGESFRLFAAANYHGTFAGVNLPPLVCPYLGGPSLMWSNSLSVDGRITVVIKPPPPIEIKDGTNVVLSAAISTNWGGMPYQIVATTNLLLPPQNWPVIASGTFGSSGSFVCTLTNAVIGPQRFFSVRFLVP
jgi:autotransporter-associated beta strand protein